MCYVKPGPRCSTHAIEELHAAKTSGDPARIKRANIAYMQTPAGIAELNAQGKTELADRAQAARDKRLDALNLTREGDTLHEEINARINSEEFHSLIAERDRTRNAYEALNDEREKIGKEVTSKQGILNRLKSKIEQDGELSPKDQEKQDKTQEELADLKERQRLAADETREAYFEALDKKQDLEEYKDGTAQRLARLSQISDFSTEEYEGETLAGLTPVGEFPPNSREWLMARQPGIGGSDVGAILKVDPEHGDSNYEAVFEDKTRDYASMDDDEFEPLDENADPSTIQGPLDRGNVWEPVIVSRFAQQNPDLQVLHTKKTWTDPNDSSVRVNLDGLVSSTGDGEPDGILEIKTASNPEEWEDGVPNGYRAQVLYYLDATGFDTGYVAVQVDDHDYREYVIHRGEDIVPHREYSDDLEENEKLNSKRQRGPVSAYKTQLKKFLAETDSVRAGGERNRRQVAPHPTIKPGGSTSAAEVIAAYSGRDVSEVRDDIRDRFLRTGDYDQAAREVFAESPLNEDQEYVFLDIETTGFGVAQSEVIEVGWSRRNGRNEVVSEGNILCSPDKRFMRAKGTGDAQDVHGISPDDVRDQPSFTDPAVQAQVNEALRGAVMVDHNHRFENSFFTQFNQEYREDTPKNLDTMMVSKFFGEGATNKLADFTESNGVEYRDAHRAYQDAAMTADALFAFDARRDKA